MPKYEAYAGLTANLESTDLVLFKNVSTTKKVTLLELETSMDGHFQKQGVVIWEDAEGATTINDIILTTGKVYEIYYAAKPGGSSINVVKCIMTGTFCDIVIYRYGDNGIVQANIALDIINERIVSDAVIYKVIEV